jgi:hypothetical protein
MRPYLLIISFLLIFQSCSTREILPDYSGSTEQRLTSHSIRKLIQSLPEKDFSLLRDKKVYLECFFLEKKEPLNYAAKRLEFELIDKYNCKMVQDKNDSQVGVHIFFTSMGTDKDKFGLSTPEFILPGVGAISSIDLIALDMFHGITELYYYITDSNEKVITKSSPLKMTVRNDSLALPIITIPISSVD